MLNAVRYGFATFLSFSRPFMFLIFATATYLVVAEIAAILGKTIGESGGAGELIPGPGAVLPLSLFGAQAAVMNALVLFLLSVPVAGQFAQEYRFNTLANTFLIAPRRVSVYFSKLMFVYVYVIASVVVMWLVVKLLGPLLPVAVGDGSGVFSPLFDTSFLLTWNVAEADGWWKILAYVCVYMTVVVSISIFTKSQALGAMLPFFYTALIEPGLPQVWGFIRGFGYGALLPAYPDEFRYFTQGQAWIGDDAAFPFAGVEFFGGCLVIVGLSLWMFVRRGTKV